MSWYDCVKWCNARSEADGLTPVYYTGAAQSQVYRSGNTPLTNACVKWTANGYRLPTDATGVPGMMPITTVQDANAVPQAIYWVEVEP